MTLKEILVMLSPLIFGLFCWKFFKVGMKIVSWFIIATVVLYVLNALGIIQV